MFAETFTVWFWDPPCARPTSLKLDLKVGGPAYASAMVSVQR